jgi:molybdenum cofactor cytidylyltransferase
MTIAVLIAAAGKSTRMGSAKALLPLNGSTFIEHLARNIIDADIRKIFVTLPECEKSAKEIKERLSHPRVHFHRNLFTQRELLGSVQSVLAQERSFDALMIIPVDMPFVSDQIIRRFVKAMQIHPAPAIFSAVCRSQRAHPVMFTKDFFQEILLLRHQDSLRTIMLKHDVEIIDIEIDDPRLLLNINTPEDYARFTKPSSKNFDAAAIDAPGAKSL